MNDRRPTRSPVCIVAIINELTFIHNTLAQVVVICGRAFM